MWQTQWHLILGLRSLLSSLLLGFLLLLHLFFFLQHGHDLGHLVGGDVHIFFVHQLDHLCKENGGSRGGQYCLISSQPLLCPTLPGLGLGNRYRGRGGPQELVVSQIQMKLPGCFLQACALSSGNCYERDLGGTFQPTVFKEEPRDPP